MISNGQDFSDLFVILMMRISFCCVTDLIDLYLRSMKLFVKVVGKIDKNMLSV